MKLIGLVGYAGTGKTTAAEYLEQTYGFERVRFAGPMKNMMRALGLTEREIEGDGKEQPCAVLCGKTPRYAMQLIGTEWGRHLIGSDIWVNAWKRNVLGRDRVVVEDCRFPNEERAIRDLGGTIWRIARKGHEEPPFMHESESYRIKHDATVCNGAGLGAFYEAIDAACLNFTKS